MRTTERLLEGLEDVLKVSKSGVIPRVDMWEQHMVNSNSS